MAVELRRVPGAPMAQTVHIRAHDLVADGSVEEGGTDSGPRGSSSQRGAFRMIPGEASGRMSVKAKAPAFPAEAPAAGPSRSITVTESPRPCAISAADSPTTPAPMTTTFIPSGRVARLQPLGPIRIPCVEHVELRLDEPAL